METNEHIDWKELDEKDKSYTVRVLNFFHFRRNRLHRSWKREEVLTWELIRALDILPKDYFLREFLLTIKDKNKRLSIIDFLLKKINNLEIISYPNLGFKGIKRNSASDIGIKSGKNCLWIEVKTNLIDESELQKQIKIQKDSPDLCSNKNFDVIALIPSNQKYIGPSIFWKDVIKSFKNAELKLQKDWGNNVINGYLKISQELIKRIEARDI